MINAVLRLRRDNDYNYVKIENTFIPMKGEVCLVDTARDGLRTKIGDGETVWKELGYVDEYVVKGYYFEGKFYRDMKHTVPVDGTNNKIYIDVAERLMYHFDGIEYVCLSNTVEAATETISGIMKLYQSIGYNTDGTMSQKAITNELEDIVDELDDKVEITLNASEELLIFTY